MQGSTASLTEEAENNLRKFETQVEDMHGILLNISTELVNIRVSSRTPLLADTQGK
jgi:hypothetical protein